MGTYLPPFPIPSNIKNGPGYSWVERKTPMYSDGDSNKWPREESGYRSSNKDFYLCHLGQKWAEDDGITQPGVHYYIDRLPPQYEMFEINQPSGPQIYKRLFGHPSGRFYDSAQRFTPHFLWLMSGMEGDCPCGLCMKRSRQFQPRFRDANITPSVPRPAPRMKEGDGDSSEHSQSRDGGLAHGRAQRRVRQTGEPYAVDEEGNEDIYKDCVKKVELAQGGTSGIEIDLTEENSIDWKADRESLPQYLTQIEQQHAFMPRIGELVLWCTTWPDSHFLMPDPHTSEQKFFSFEHQKFTTFPEWRGGIVASIPSDITKNGIIDFGDILEAPVKQTALNTAGFRVETMPDPNDDLDKSMSKQYKYMPLRNIRPLSQWQILLNGIEQSKIHASVFFALTCMTSMSLLEKWRFLGDWPNGRVFCKGIHLGAELLTVGDTVRFKSQLLSVLDANKDRRIDRVDVLVVSSIRYNMIDMKTEHALPGNPSLSSTSFISLVGDAYTTDVDRAYGGRFHDTNSTSIKPVPIALDKAKGIFRPVGADEYGPWYPLHAPHQKFEVSHEQVFGRLYEAEAVRLWTGQRNKSNLASRTRLSKPSLGFDVDGIIAGRRYATATDERLPEPNDTTSVNWFMADSRAQALGIASLNGIDVGRYHTVRNTPTLQHWRQQIKVADGRDSAPDHRKDRVMIDWKDIATGGRRGRPAGSRVINGKLIRPGHSYSLDDTTPQIEMKSSSQMAEAALASDSEDEGYEHGSNLYHSPEKGSTSDAGSDISSDPERQLSKQQIMASVEMPEDDEDHNGDDSEEDEWLNSEPVLRGGTEESAGGDYRGE